MEHVSVLARYLGVEDFRTGCQTLRDKLRWRVGVVNVVHAWRASVLPSSHDCAFLGVARTEDSEYRDRHFPSFFRAGIAVVARHTEALKQVVVVDIEIDEMVSVLSRFNLLESDNTVTLDGIGYEIDVNTSAISASLKFSNPAAACLRETEKALFETGRTIAQRSGEAVVLDYIEMWGSYLSR